MLHFRRRPWQIRIRYRSKTSIPRFLRDERQYPAVERQFCYQLKLPKNPLACVKRVRVG